MFEKPVSVGGLLRVDTGPLQQIAVETDLGTLKLSICSDNPEIFSQLDIHANSPRLLRDLGDPCR